MGGGAWTKASAESYVKTSYSAYGAATLDDLAKMSVKQVYSARRIDPSLDPKGVVRECRDSAEHPETFPIILALDVTGSMGYSAKMCAAKLNDIMENLYGKVKDVEFLMMGIGDLAYDDAPIQATQFESDVRILDQATKIYFEGGGGGNPYESYTAAWYFGLHNTDLDCWKRGKKGIIITLGDEPLNPYLPGKELGNVLGQPAQDVDTELLYEEVCKKFDVYHIVITDSHTSAKRYEDGIIGSWRKLLGQRCLYATCEELDKVIGRIVDDSNDSTLFSAPISDAQSSKEGIGW